MPEVFVGLVCCWGEQNNSLMFACYALWFWRKVDEVSMKWSAFLSCICFIFYRKFCLITMHGYTTLYNAHFINTTFMHVCMNLFY